MRVMEYIDGVDACSNTVTALQKKRQNRKCYQSTEATIAFDREKYREQIKLQLKDVSRDKCVACAVWAALRVMPLLSSRKKQGKEIEKNLPAFWFWKKKERCRHLLAVLNATSAAICYAVNQVHPAGSASATAAFAADSTSTADAIKQAIAIDLSAMSEMQAVELLNSPLWPNKLTKEVNETKQGMVAFAKSRKSTSSDTAASTFSTHWQHLLAQFKADVLSLNAGFEVWLDWYDDRIQGKPIDGVLLERWNSVPGEVAGQGAAAVNAYLATLAKEKSLAPLNRVRAIFIGYGESGKTSQFTVLKKLRALSASNAFIKFDDFNALCEEQRIGNEGPQNREWLLDILDKLGVVIHFPNLPCLDEYVLNPRWLTYGVYTLIYCKKARLTEKEVVDLLSRERVTDEFGQVLKYPPQRCRFIMDAMCEFKLCYYLPHDNKRTLIIPALLPSDQPKYEFDTSGSLAFEFVFRGFLPRHVLPEMIVCRHEEIVKETVWQHGVLLRHRELQATALVRADYHERTLSIRVRGRDAKDYLHLLRDEALDILARLQIDYEEKIELPLDTAIDLDASIPPLQSPEKADYQQLLNSMKRGMFRFPGNKHVYDLQKVLGLILPDEKFNLYVGGNMQQTNLFGNTLNNSPVVAAENITDSFNRLASARLDDGIKSALTELLNEIKSLNSKVPAAQTQHLEDLSNDAKALVAESARPEPRAARYKISLEGIKEAAQTLGKIAEPILSIVQKIGGLLG